MKESYGEGPATHTGPESCVPTREGRAAGHRWGSEALTGVHVGRVLSRERALKSGMPTSYGERKATRARAIHGEPDHDPPRSETPAHAWNHLVGSREISSLAWRRHAKVRRARPEGR